LSLALWSMLKTKPIVFQTRARWKFQLLWKFHWKNVNTDFIRTASHTQKCSYTAFLILSTLKHARVLRNCQASEPALGRRREIFSESFTMVSRICSTSNCTAAVRTETYVLRLYIQLNGKSIDMRFNLTNTAAVGQAYRSRKRRRRPPSIQTEAGRRSASVRLPQLLNTDSVSRLPENKRWRRWPFPAEYELYGAHTTASVENRTGPRTLYRLKSGPSSPLDWASPVISQANLLRPKLRNCHTSCREKTFMLYNPVRTIEMKLKQDSFKTALKLSCFSQNSRETF